LEKQGKTTGFLDNGKDAAALTDSAEDIRDAVVECQVRSCTVFA
jgi:hypothetical protein